MTPSAPSPSALNEGGHMPSMCGAAVRADRLAGAVLLALWCALALAKFRAGMLPDMLWACHVASLVLALSLLLHWRSAAAAGFLFHVAVALPAYLLHLCTCGDTSVLSALLHAASPLFGWLSWRGQRLPVRTPWLAALACAVLIAVSHALTPPALNVNLAFRPWAPLARWDVRASHTVNMLLMSAQLVAAYGLLNRWARPPQDQLA